MYLLNKHQKCVSNAFYLKLFFSATILLFAGNAFAQTPGLIYDPATGAGAAVLDPNNDGYTSTSDNGFITDDQLESELLYSSFIFPSDELPGDLGSGPSCGFTDFVDEGDRDPAQKYLDGANNLLFRLRLGGSASASKSYSILIDTDYKFGNTGINADPDFTPTNPGFEIEISMGTNFGVFVYDVSSATPNCSPVISYPGHTNYQKSIALSMSCGDMDYFYDFFVPFGDLTSQFGITTSTPLRYVIVDNMAADKSSICNPNSISDIAGLGFCTNLAQCYIDVIDPQGGCSANQAVCLYESECPDVTSTLVEGATTVSGTSTEANGTVITVYKNGTSIGTTAVSSGAWSLTGITPSLAAFDTIFVTALASGKAESDYDCNYALVTSATCTPMITALDICNSGKALQGYAAPGSVINLYYGVGGTALTPSSGYNYSPGTITAGTVPSTLSITTDNWLWKCVGSGQSSSCTSGGAPCLGDGAYRMTATLPGMCESQPVWFCLGSSGPTATPTITTTNLTSASTTVSGTLAAPDNVAGASIVLYVNSNWVGTGTTIAGGAWTINSLTLHGCDTVKVFAISGTKCLSNASNSVIVTNGVTATPTVQGTYCTLVNITTVSGISTEDDGTVIQVYENGIAEGSTVTVTDGAWVATTGISIAPGSTITAKATAPCKSQSVASVGVVVGLKTTDASLAITSSPIYEQDSTISGTATAGNTIQLYVDGYPTGSSVVSSGTWTITGLNIYDLYTQAVLTVTSTSPTGCASAPSASKIVICIPPTLALSVNPDSFVTCAGDTSAVSVSVVNSEASIIYQLTNGGTNTGSSKLGNGGTLTLTSFPLTSSTTLKVKAIKIPLVCVESLTDSISVVFNPNPTLSLTLGATTNPTCEGVPTNVTVANSQTGFMYQLRDNSNNALVGTAVAGNGGTINLSTGALSSAKTFNVLVTGIAPSFCNAQLSSTITINVDPAPVVPSGSASQSFCSSTNPTVANLTATGSSLQWYAASTGGSPLAGSTPLVTATTYYATQTSGGCESLSRFAVAVTITTQPAATISYAGTPYCTSLAAPQSVTLTGTGGGTFSSTAGLTINSGTGAITPSTSTGGSYVVTYTIAATGACGITTTTTNVTITTAPSATVSYAGSPYCNSVATAQSPTVTGTTGGTFSAAAGLTLNTSTGAVTPSTSTPGTYTVTYTVAAAGGCALFSTTASVTITAAPSASISYVGMPFCKSLITPQSVTQTGTTGGTYSSTAGLTINAATGAITPSTSTAGTYTVTYTVAAAGGCSIYTTTTSVTITATPSATISYSGSPYCSSLSSGQSVTLTGTSGGTFSSTAGLTINAATGAITPSTSTAGAYTITYTVTAAGGCSVFTTTASATITSAPNATVSYPGSPYCTSVGTPQAPTFSGTTGGTYSASPAGLTLNASTGAVTPSTSTTGTYTVTYTVSAAGGCSIYTTTATVSISTNFSATISYAGSPYCTSVSGAQSVSFTGDAGGTFSSSAGLTIDANTGQITPSTSTAGVYVVNYDIPTSGGCAAFNTTASVTINQTPTIASVNSNSPVCFDTNINLSVTSSGSPTYSWSGPGGFTSNSQTPVISSSALTAGTYSVTATENGCASAPSSVVVVTMDCYPVANPDSATTSQSATVNIPVSSNDTDPQNNLDLNSITITYAPSNGTAVVGVAGSIAYTPDSGFIGVDTFIYQICDNTIPVPFCDTALVVVNTIFINTAPTVNDTTVTTLEDTPITVCLPISDPDNGQTFSVTSCGLPANGLVATSIVGSQVCITYTPNSNFNGSDNLCIVICDDYTTAGCDTANIFINVTTVNDPPVINGGDTTVTTNEDTPITVCIPITNADAGQTLSVSSCGLPANGLVTSSIVGSQVCVTYTPNQNFNGTDSLCIIVCDDGSPVACDTATITVNISPVNDPPVINDTTVTSTEDSVITVCLTITDVDSGDVFTSSSCNTPTNGTSTTTIIDSILCITYTPNPNSSGTDSLCIIVCDNVSPAGCDTVVIVIDVAPVNDPPVINDTTVTTSEDLPITVCLPISDAEIGQTYSVNSCGLPLNGLVSTSIVGSQVCVTYTPNANFNGQDNLCIIVCDNGSPSGCDSATITINVTPVNDPPVIGDGSDTTVTTNEDTPITVCIPINDGDTGDTYNVSLCNVPANGSATSVITGSNVCVTYTPNPSFNGTDSLCVIVCDNGSPAGCDTITIIVNVVPVNNPPTINDTIITTPEETPITVCLPIIDVDVAQVYVVSSCGLPVNGLVVSVISGSQVCVTYTPNANFNGLDTLCVIVCDNGLPQGCDTAMVYINVTPVNDPPVVNDSTITTLENTPITVCLPISDSDGAQTFTVTSCGGPTNGTATSSISGNQVCITYTPNTDFNGIDNLCVIVCDNGTPTGCDSAIITINVVPVNNVPGVNDTTITTPEDTAITICLAIADPDLGQTYTVTSCGNAANGTSTSTVNGNQVCITYTPNANYYGLDSLCIIVCDNGTPSGCDTAHIYINVTPVNDDLIVNDSSITTPENTPITVCLPILDVDAGQTYSVSSCGDPINGLVASVINGSQVCVTYTPNTNFNGLDSLCIVVCDNGNPTMCDTAHVYITVTPINNLPSVNDSTITTPEDTAITVCIPIIDVDVNQTYTVTSCGDPINGTATTTINGTEVCITYTPNPDYNGLDSLCITVCDNSGGCDNSMIYIIVTPVNDAPIVNDTTITTPEDSTITVCLPITDIDSQSFTVSSCGEPMNGTATLEVNGNEVCVTYTPNPDFNGSDSLCLVVCDDGNPTMCDSAMVYIIVTPQDENALIIPQGFSPNNDGKNDMFQIVGLENYPDNDIQIFNRWGNVVFATKAYQNDWDGTTVEGLRIGGDALPTGTYFYTLKLSPDLDVIKGFIYLTR